MRYKCSVCKNFDYCEVCEERQSHEHPFIKLTRADQVPSSIVIGVNEDQEDRKEGDEFEHVNHENHHHHHDHHEPNEHHGRYHRGGHRGRGGLKHMACHWMKFAEKVMSKALNGTPDEEEKNPREHSHCRASRSKWSAQRAIVVSKPNGPIECQANGETIFVPIEVMNQTKWPWKRGCLLGLTQNN